MERSLTRRNFLTRTAAIGAGAAAAVAGTKTASAQIKIEPPTNKPFIDQYYDGMLKIVKDIRATQVPNIAKAMTTAYDLKQKGGKLSCAFQTGHLVMFGASADVPGQPGIFPNDHGQRGPALTKGDFTIGLNGNQNARNNGVYVVGVTNSYTVTRHTPKGALSSNAAPMEDSCDLVIDCQQPWQNGLVRAPWVETFHVMPSAGNANLIIYWACTASIANLIGTKGKGSPTTPVEQYLDMAIERITKLGNDRKQMAEITSKWADLVVSDKARCLVYGHRQLGTNYQGCTNMFVNECYQVAEGTAWADQYELHDAAHANDLKKNDVVLIGAFTSNNADEIFVAQTARRAGAYTTAFCPFTTDGDDSGYRLHKEVDSAINTYSDERDGVLQIPGYSSKICPLSGVIGNVAHWMLMSTWCDNMAARGKQPHFWQAFAEAGGRELDNIMQEEYKKVGY
jgi:hypothetical protein